MAARRAAGRRNPAPLAPLFSWKGRPTIAGLCSCRAAHAAPACPRGGTSGSVLLWSLAPPPAAVTQSSAGPGADPTLRGLLAATSPLPASSQLPAALPQPPAPLWGPSSVPGAVGRAELCGEAAVRAPRSAPCPPYVRPPPSSPPAPASPGRLSGPRSTCPARPPSPSASSAWRPAHPPAGRAAAVTPGGHPRDPRRAPAPSPWETFPCFPPSSWTSSAPQAPSQPHNTQTGGG